MSDKKLKPQHRYITIAAEAEGDEFDATVKKLFFYLEEGWRILQATGVAGGVHYIITDQSLPPLDIGAGKSIKTAEQGLPEKKEGEK